MGWPLINLPSTSNASIYKKKDCHTSAPLVEKHNRHNFQHAFYLRKDDERSSRAVVPAPHDHA